ncbi:MAG: glycosyl transferase family 1 [Candidatus Marinimicrobia bacterium]|nr:glycosyl transferase family 1 [Candidatus Neomarinimicrobiota bacterium]|tara:strand:+ start:3707 stop:4813 length:1107 start_codon:yes stop_codon:yes gene_type:complete
MNLLIGYLFYYFINIKIQFLKLNMDIVINARFLTQRITGVQRYAIEISKELLKLNKNISVISPKNIIQHDIAKKLNVKCIGKLKGHLWEQITLPIYLNKKNNPILLNFCNTAPLFYKNKIITLHDIAFKIYPENFSFLFQKYYNFIIPKLLLSSKQIFTVSEFSKNEILRHYNFVKDVKVIYNACNENFKPKKKTNQKKYILAVSSITKQKNFRSLIDAFKLIENKNINLYIVGKINKNLIDEQLPTDMEKNIQFFEDINDFELINLYSNAEALIHPSYYEGFGIPPIEAMACGCPTIVSNKSSLPEICGDASLYIDPIDINDIQKKINFIINDKNAANDLIIKGFKQVNKYSWEYSATKMLKIISNI